MRYRASIYLDIEVEPEEGKDPREEALRTAESIREHLSFPEENRLPENYFNPYVGGVATMQELMNGGGQI